MIAATGVSRGSFAFRILPPRCGTLAKIGVMNLADVWDVPVVVAEDPMLELGAFTRDEDARRPDLKVALEPLKSCESGRLVLNPPDRESKSYD